MNPKKVLQHSLSVPELLKALDYYEHTDPVGFLRLMYDFPFFDARPGSIGQLLNRHSDRFPYLQEALVASTAMSCYFTEPDPCGVSPYMQQYIAKSNFCSAGVVEYFIRQRKGVFRFIDEDAYEELKQGLPGVEHRKLDSHFLDLFLRRLHAYKIALKQLEFYGMAIQSLPEALPSCYPALKLYFKDCLLAKGLAWEHMQTKDCLYV